MWRARKKASKLVCATEAATTASILSGAVFVACNASRAALMPRSVAETSRSVPLKSANGVRAPPIEPDVLVGMVCAWL